MRGQEKENMINMVDDLIKHLEKRNNKSLLAKIYGIYTIKTNAFKDVDFLVM